MKTLRKMIIPRIAMTLIAVLTTGLALNFSGCTEQSPIQPGDNEAQSSIATLHKVVNSNIGTIRILEANFSLSSGLTPDRGFYAEKVIKAKKGGSVTVGNRESGKSEIVFQSKALPKDMTISFQWAASGTFEGLLSNVEFGPQGIIFNKPVKMVLSYKMANLTGIDEDKLQVFYFNQDTDMWELIVGTVDKKKKKVIAYINHFSRYAVAYSN